MEWARQRGLGGRARRAAVGALLALVATSCATPWGARPRAHCPIALVPSGALQEGGAWRARIELSHTTTAEPRRMRAEIAARVEGGVLRLAALTPFGTRAFSITQAGVDTAIDDRLGRRLGIEPLWVLDAFHRLYALDAEREPAAAGERQWARAGEWIEESQSGGSQRRRFAAARTDPTAGPRGEWRAEVTRSPRRSSVRNDWCGYEIAWLAVAP